MFGASRVAGWCAHVEEQRNVGRLIRPASIYVGPMGTAVEYDERRCHRLRERRFAPARRGDVGPRDAEACQAADRSATIDA
jgi:hypothetical protein